MKNFILDQGEFESYLVTKKVMNVLDSGGIQYVFRFPNYYGASVVKHRGSYGYNVDMWELAVIKFTDADNDSWDLNYDTPITSDVIGYLTDDEVRETLGQIMEL